jgi:lipopolysaccharide transport system permease protein
MKDFNAHKIDFEEEITPKGNLSINFGELWAYRELFFIFSWRDIKVKYKQTSLGILWALLQPLAMVTIFTLTIGRLLPVTNQNALPYPVFVYSGLIFWYLFSNGITNASNSMLNNEAIIKKIYFPRLIIPFSSILIALFDFFITLVLYIAILVYYHAEIDLLKFILYIPLALLISLLSIFGIGTFLAALNIKFRDFRYTIPFLMQFLMFASPIFYPTHIVENKLIADILKLNPMNSILELSRSIFLNQEPDWHTIILGILVSTASFFLGLIYFRKTEAYFADIS